VVIISSSLSLTQFVSFDVQFHDSRVDRVIARKDGTFEVLEGAPGPTNPVAPPEQKRLNDTVDSEGTSLSFDTS